jgi:SAM-dependent methyltransferase
MPSLEPFVEFDRLFNEDYDYFVGSQLTEDRTVSEVDEIVEAQALKPGARVLDVHCGHGRHANVLAARGYKIVGIDRVQRFIEMARADAARRHLSVDYRHMDLRELDLNHEFDAAFSWFGSFGYFDDDTDLDILVRIRRALRPGGSFLLDMQSPYRLIPALIAGQGTCCYQRRIGNDIAVDVLTLDAVGSRYLAKRIAVRDGVAHEAAYAVRAFTAPEISAWFKAAGFSGVTVRAERGEAFTVQSRRLVVKGTV